MSRRPIDIGGPLRVAIFQYGARDEPPMARLAKLDRALAGLRGNPVDLIICPELFLSGYHVGDRIAALAQPRDGPFARAMAALAAKWRSAIVYGYPERAGARLHNAAACVDRDGRLVANHRKIQLPNNFERACFTAGSDLTVFTIAGHRVALLICYDVEFPEVARAVAADGAEIVIVPTALSEDWAVVARKMVPTRAFENGIFLLYANYAGREGGVTYLGESVVVAPDGEELARAGAAEAVIRATLDPMRITAARHALSYLEDRPALAPTGQRVFPSRGKPAKPRAAD